MSCSPGTVFAAINPEPTLTRGSFEEENVTTKSDPSEMSHKAFYASVIFVVLLELQFDLVGFTT